MNKKMKEMYSTFTKNVFTPLAEAVKILKSSESKRNFKQSIDIDISLKPKKKQDIPSSYVFNVVNGLPKNLKILAVVSALDCERLRRENKLDCLTIGIVDDVKNIVEAGKTHFNAIVTNKDTLISMVPYAKRLVGLGLMPSVKTGTVFEDMFAGVLNMVGGTKLVTKKNKNEIRLKIANIDFSENQIVENVKCVCSDLMSIISDDLVSKITLSSTMGPGVRLNHKELCKKSVSNE